MSKKRMLWAVLPLVLLLSPWPAWLWWRQQGPAREGWVEPVGELSRIDEPMADEVGGIRQIVRSASGPSEGMERDTEAGAEERRASGEGEARSLDAVFVRQLLVDGGLAERIGRASPWAGAEQRRLLIDDWVQALSLLRTQHRAAKEAGGVQMALIGAPGDLLFSLMPDLGEELDVGRAGLRTPEKPVLDPGLGTATARFALEPVHKTLLVEVRTRYGYYDLELGRDCGEPDLRAAVWKQSGLLWGAFLK